MCNEILKQLEQIAYNQTIPFCYGCYKEAPASVCSTCQSDDLMRLLPGYGVEYGVDWVIKILLEENLETVDCDEVFESMIEDCYEQTTKVGFMELSTVDVMKNQDPVWWNIAQNEYIDSLVQDGEIISFDNGSTYYWIHELEEYIQQNL